jgi:hypothetical protein
MIAKLTITSRFLSASALRWHLASHLMIFFVAGCLTQRSHQTSEQQIKRATDKFTNESDYTCRPSDPERSGDYIWIYSEPPSTVKLLRIASYSPLGKSGYKHEELVLLSGVEVSKTAEKVEVKTGAETSGSFDTQYDVSKQNTLLTIDNATMLGRLQVKGYAGNLKVACSKKP